MTSHPWAPSEATSASAYHPLIEFEFRRCELETACIGQRCHGIRVQTTPCCADSSVGALKLQHHVKTPTPSVIFELPKLLACHKACKRWELRESGPTVHY